MVASHLSPPTITRFLLSTTRNVCCFPHVRPHQPKTIPHKYEIQIVNLAIASSSRASEIEMEVNGAVTDAEKLRSQFLQLLRTRRNAEGKTHKNKTTNLSKIFQFCFSVYINYINENFPFFFLVPLTVEPAKPVVNPLYQGGVPPPTSSEVKSSFMIFFFFFTMINNKI